MLRYTFLFDPSEAWSHLSQFESDLIEFFSVKGLEGEVISLVNGQLGEKMLELKRIDLLQRATNNNKQPLPQKPQNQPVNPRQMVQKAQTQRPDSSFKQYQDRGVPKTFNDETKRSPKLNFQVSGKTNRMKVRTPNG